LLPAKKVYTVGRLATDLIVAQDLSISRNHVQIHLPGEEEEDDCLQIEDLGSRYGTFTPVTQAHRLLVCLTFDA